MVEFVVPIAPNRNSIRGYQAHVSMIANTAKVIFNWQMAVNEKVVVFYKFYWPDKRTRDKSNQKKVINDALQGIIVDNDNNILERDIDWLLDKVNPRIELKIMRKDDADVRDK